MKRIAFIIPYFGKFNNYFNLWLESCRNNPTVDWYILTDNTDDYHFPDNVHKMKTTMVEMKEAFSKAFGFEVALDRPYKLCDLKPSYGYVFPEIIKGYDFWGWCDVDLIFGNIRQFLTDEIFDKYDMISRWAHCTLIRNNEMNNKLFMTRLASSLNGGGICRHTKKLTVRLSHTSSMKLNSCSMRCIKDLGYILPMRYTMIAA